ncbi:3-hydroxyacyl-CoA dehydrogenase @ 17hydroxysteroid dehydrogenase type 10 (HSD10)-like [hydrothermal vent metagenome]|uniref:3-hydroxyacyl-CoA dehydrogenase @ 17hydroxysteroid dehydrogenase type 10 (HSD10)-like n=1 Tax=hydrothermal vent metagenome TaxID=652676 RepID=A0A3B0XA16_9ZZZZ
MQFSQVKAIVTGAASGLGLAVVQRIVQAGGKAVIFDADIEAAENSAFSSGGDVIALQVDVCDENSVAAALKEAIDYLGSVNLLVNCAGILKSSKVVSATRVMPVEDFQRQIAVNLTGTFIVLKAVAEMMRDNMAGADEERGVIINTASIAAFEGQIGQVAYSAGKGAVASMTLPLARELADFNIRVMCIAPGVFDTKMMAGVSDEIKNSIIKQSLFPPRMGDASEFAQLVEQIVENPMLNACVIRLDGGLRMPAH